MSRCDNESAQLLQLIEKNGLTCIDTSRKLEAVDIEMEGLIWKYQPRNLAVHVDDATGVARYRYTEYFS